MLQLRDVHFSPIWASCILTLINPKNITGERSLVGTCSFPEACGAQWAQLSRNPPIALALSAYELLWGWACSGHWSSGRTPRLNRELNSAALSHPAVMLHSELILKAVFMFEQHRHTHTHCNRSQSPVRSLAHTLPQTHWHTCAHCNGSLTRSGGSSLAGSVSCRDGCWCLLAAFHTAWFISCYRRPWLFAALGWLARHRFTLPGRDIKVRDKK